MSDPMPGPTPHTTIDDRAETAIAQLCNLPFVSEPLPGIGGTIKAEPGHFVVTERLPYEPCGQGEHVYVTFRRSGWNTADAAKAMQKRLGLAPSDVGWGGRKDKTAVVEQTVSLRCGVKHPLEAVEQALADLPFDILGIDRHGNKIKTGHVAANRFEVVVSDVDADALPRARVIARKLEQTGVPNFYGPQRFGHGLKNVQRGFALFNFRRKGHKNAFMASVVQSALFNIWLRQRIENGDFDHLITGDIVKKSDTGGMFIVENLSAESPRFDAKEIVFTGPIFGFKMKPAMHDAGERENALLVHFSLSPEDFRPLRSPGSRRMAILHSLDLKIDAVAEGLCFQFTLPSGAYATTVLREFTRQPF